MLAFSDHRAEIFSRKNAHKARDQNSILCLLRFFAAEFQLIFAPRARRQSFNG